MENIIQNLSGGAPDPDSGSQEPDDRPKEQHDSSESRDGSEYPDDEADDGLHESDFGSQKPVNSSLEDNDFSEDDDYNYKSHSGPPMTQEQIPTEIPSLVELATGIFNTTVKKYICYDMACRYRLHDR